MATNSQTKISDRKPVIKKKLDNEQLMERGPVIKKKLNNEQLMERGMELVRGIFKYDEMPGGTLVFSFHKYKKVPTKTYRLKDGEVVRIPRCVAKHLATKGQYVVHEYQRDEQGNSVIRIGRKKRRYHFESMEFFEDEEILNSNDSNLYTVEKVNDLKI